MEPKQDFLQALYRVSEPFVRQSWIRWFKPSDLSDRTIAQKKTSTAVRLVSVAEDVSVNLKDVTFDVTALTLTPPFTLHWSCELHKGKYATQSQLEPVNAQFVGLFQQFLDKGIQGRVVSTDYERLKENVRVQVLPRQKPEDPNKNDSQRSVAIVQCAPPIIVSDGCGCCESAVPSYCYPIRTWCGWRGRFHSNCDPSWHPCYMTYFQPTFLDRCCETTVYPIHSNPVPTSGGPVITMSPLRNPAGSGTDRQPRSDSISRFVGNESDVAIKSLTQPMRRVPTLPDFKSLPRTSEQAQKWYGLGIMHYRAGEHEVALAYLTAATEITNDARYWIYRGIAELALGRNDQADDSFQSGWLQVKSHRSDKRLLGESLELVQGSTRNRIETIRKRLGVSW